MTDTTTAIHNDELSLLAACMNGYDPHSINLTPEDFDQPKHAAVWRAIHEVLDKGQTIDPQVVYDALGPTFQDDAVWVFDIFSKPVMPENAPSFAAHIRRAADLRALQDVGRGLMQRAGLELADPSEVMAWARGKLDAPTGTTRLTETFADSLPRVLEQVKTGQQAGLSTPWPDLDEKIHGLSPGRVYVIAARPGGGKSLAGQNLAWHWAYRHKLPVYFASLEMTTDEITTRTLAQVARVPLDRLQTGALEDADDSRTARWTHAITNTPVHMCTDGAQTIDTIRNGARQIQRQHGLGLIIVDYLQLVRARDARVPRREQVDEIARGLKLMAKELDVPVVAMAQLNREGSKDKGRPPVLADLRESGEIEQAADVVILLHRPDPDDIYAGQLYVAKARNGSLGPVDVIMRTWFASIDSMERRSA